MKKYIIILLSFLGLFFINVDIVSADSKISSKLTEAQVQEIKKRINEAGIPVDHKDDVAGNYKDFTDYVIYIKKDDLGSSNKVTLTLYTKKRNGERGWYGDGSYDLTSFDLTKSQDYWLEFDKAKKKWKWKTDFDFPWAIGSIGINGYIFSATESISEGKDSEMVFFPPRSPLELILEGAKARMTRMTLQFWQNLVPYGIILLASWVSLGMLSKVLRTYLAVL